MFNEIYEKLHDITPRPDALIAQTAIFGDMAVCGNAFSRSLMRVYYVYLVRVLPEAISYPWWSLDFQPTISGEFSGEINQ